MHHLSPNKTMEYNEVHIRYYRSIHFFLNNSQEPLTSRDWILLTIRCYLESNLNVLI